MDISPETKEHRLGFALSLLGFCILILFTLVPELFQNSIDSSKVAALVTLKSGIYVIIFYLSLCILSMGYSLSPHLSLETKNLFERIASSLYTVSFYILFSAIIFSICSYLYVGYLASNLLGMFLYIAIPLLSLYCIFKSKTWKRISNHNPQVLIFYIVSLILLIGVIGTSDIASTSTDIEISMESTYDIGDSPIPITVKVVGLNNNLSIVLFEENGSQFTRDAAILFDRTNPKIEWEGVLFGTYLGDGLYDVYVNTTGMERGLYGLTFTVQEHTESKTFYLVGDKNKEMYLENKSMSPSNEMNFTNQMNSIDITVYDETCILKE